MPANRPVDRLEVVTLGVGKKATPAFHAFEFRLRTVSESGPIPKGQRLLWSCVFPVKQGLGIPPEAFLHLPQKQQFTPHQFLEQKTIVIENPAVSMADSGLGRIALGDESKVTLGSRFTDWDRLRTWNPQDALTRIDACRPGPFDLEVELQEEVVLHNWGIDKPEKRDADNVLMYPITCDGIQYDAIVPTTSEGTILKGELDNLLKKKRRQPLFGLMHYEKCRLVFQPLSLLPGDGPEYLTLSKDKVERAALLKTIKF
jgi:hypothetical protein